MSRTKSDKRERKVAAAQERLEQLKAANTIVSTAIVNSTLTSKQKASVTSSFVRGAVGTMINPAVGLIGALTPKKKIVTKGGTVTFSILYASGDRTVETVKVGSKRYNELAKYVVQ